MLVKDWRQRGGDTAASPAFAPRRRLGTNTGVDPTLARGVSAEPPPRVVAIGNFDGVHLGHRAVLAHVIRDAALRGLEPAVLTFAPHPLSVLGRPVPPVLTSTGRKVELLRRLSPALVPIVEQFDLGFAALTPEEFARDVLARLGARVVTVGDNFRFGKGRAGDFDELARLGERFGFETRSHELIGDESGPWSSTRVRQAIARGDMEGATRMLGRPHMIDGTVVEGDRRGRTIGFPTCNLAGIEETLPPFGVYAVLVDLAEGPIVGPNAARRGLAKGVANIGVRPTVKADAPPTVEIHLFDFAGDLYGARLHVHLVSRLRPERTFEGLEALKAQITLDAGAARATLADVVPDPNAAGGYR